MFLSFILMTLIAFGGLALTYLFAERANFLWRLAAGNIIGSALFGLAEFVIADFFGLSATTVIFGILIAAAPVVLLAKKDFRAQFLDDWRAALKQLDNANFDKFLRAAFYAAFFVLFAAFFSRAMLETPQGILTGASQNTGDLPFHLGAIYSFVDGNNFPPENPSFAGARFSYPFIADFLTACLMKLGIGITDAMFVQNLFWALSLLVVLEKFVCRLIDDRRAGKIAAVLLFFSGGLGFVWFFHDYWQSGKDFLDFFRHLPGDYTISNKFRWGNSLVVLFITQRSFLIGMPLTIIVLQKLWEVFTAAKTESSAAAEERQPASGKSFAGEFTLPLFFVGLLAGTLPLIHLHSLFVLFVVTGFLFVFRPAQSRAWIAFGIGTALVAIPELIWSTAGSASRTSEFIGWNIGWHKKPDESIFWFWLKNTGIFLPLLLTGVYLAFSGKWRRKEGEKGEKGVNFAALLLFYVPFVGLFIICNIFKFAPWEWDNIKILIYWFIASLPFVALVLTWLARAGAVGRAASAVCLILLTVSGAIDVWRTASRQINYPVFDRDAVLVAEMVKQKTAPNALFLHAPTYNSAIVLSGRRSLMRYTAHLASHGIDYGEREADVQRVLEGGATAGIFLRKHGIEYVLISPAEYEFMKEKQTALGEEFFARFPLVAQSGDYRVYQVK